MTAKEILELLPCDYCRPYLTDMTSGPVHQECGTAQLYKNFAYGKNLVTSEKMIARSINKKLKANPDYFSNPARANA